MVTTTAAEWQIGPFGEHPAVPTLAYDEEVCEMVGGDDAHSCKGPDRTRFSRKAQGLVVDGHRIAQV